MTRADTPQRPNPADVARSIEAELRAVAKPERAEHERNYLKSELEFLGASVPAIRRVAGGVHARNPDLTHAQVMALVDALWSVPIHERRAAAVELLDLYADALEPGAIVLVERFLRQARTWALVDGLASTVVGRLVADHPELAPTLDRWADEEDFWLRRAALLALLGPLRQGGGDPDRFFRYADRMLDEKEFFVRKAIGWVLREMGKRRPELVRTWLTPRTHRASGVTLREAVKYLEPADRDALMHAYREKRPLTEQP